MNTASHPSLCPNCGLNLVPDAQIEAGNWIIVPGFGAYWRGELVTNRNSWVQILLAMAAANGRTLRCEALANRASARESSSSIRTQICLLKRAILRKGAVVPWESKRGPGNAGYRWIAA